MRSSRLSRAWSPYIGRVFTLLVLLSGSAGGHSVAQDQPVEFSHGFYPGGTGWTTTADILRSRLHIETLVANTPWDRPFNEQSAVLRDALNSWGRTSVIGMAHSNGGLVTRNYVQQNGSASRLDRLATIGTPHRGASIAANMVNGRAVNYFGNLAGSLGAAVNFYSNNDPNWYVHPVVNGTVEFTFGAMQYLGNYMANSSRFVGLGIGGAMPVTSDVSPGSGFLNQLNGAGGLSTESSVLRYRVGMAAQVHPNGALFRLITSNPRRWRAIQGIAAYGALSLYFYYSEHPDWWLASHATYWLQAYWYISLLDVAWHDFIGALRSWNGYFAVVDPSDAFIPHWSSQYPNAHIQYNLYLPYYNISHTEEKDHPAARNQFENVLVNDFGVIRRESTSPPPDDGTTCTTTSTELQCPV